VKSSLKAAGALLAIAVTAMPLRAETVQRARYLMGTMCEVSVQAAHEAEIEAAFAEAARIEKLISTWRPESELSRLNAGSISAPGAELGSLLALADEWTRATNGAFSPRVKGLVDVWRTRESGTMPDRAAIARALQSSQIEEGGFGKGYAIDRMLALMTASDATVNFGGQIATRGVLTVGIADPEDRERAVIELTLDNASISTSSGSEKTFEHAGRRFSHIFDPRTGEALPPRGSATVIASSATAADILSTALYVMGEEDALRWADANDIAAVFINSHRQIRLSREARERARDLRVIDRTFSVKE
jgi:thiamine biosynthesis lipoprotein